MQPGYGYLSAKHGGGWVDGTDTIELERELGKACPKKHTRSSRPPGVSLNKNPTGGVTKSEVKRELNAFLKKAAKQTSR